MSSATNFFFTMTGLWSPLTENVVHRVPSSHKTPKLSIHLHFLWQSRMRFCKLVGRELETHTPFHMKPCKS